VTCVVADTVHPGCRGSRKLPSAEGESILHGDIEQLVTGSRSINATDIEKWHN